MAAQIPPLPRSWTGRRVLLWQTLLITMCAALLWFYTAHNRFPYFYHTDEPGKVRQVIDGTRNFHHPLLMIAATDLALRVLHLERTPQNVAIVGRWFSAVASVLAIAGLVVLASRHFGPGLGLLAGALAGLHPEIGRASCRERGWIVVCAGCL